MYPASTDSQNNSYLKWYDPWLIGAVIGALILRLINLDQAALWHDEIETAIWSTLSWPQVVDTTLYRVAFGRYDPNHLPLYFLIINAWTAVVGESPWLLRLPSVIFSVISVVFIAAIANTLHSKPAARWAAWLAALSPFLIHHAQEARMYPLICMLAAASLLLLVRFITGASRRLSIGFFIVNLALIATHYYTVFLIFAEILVLLWYRPRPWSSWVPAALASCAAILALVYIALFLTDPRSGEIYKIGLFAFPGSVWAMLVGYTLLPSSEELHALGRSAIWPYLPYALVTLAPFAILFLTGLKTLFWRALIVVILVLGVVILGPFAAHFVFPKISINPRYLMAGGPDFSYCFGSRCANSSKIIYSTRGYVCLAVCYGFGNCPAPCGSRPETGSD